MYTVVDAIVDQFSGSQTAEASALTMLGMDGRATTTTTWSAVHRHARRMSAVMVGDGLPRAGRVGLLGDTSVELVTAIQAVWLSGAAVTILPAPRRQGQRGYRDHLQAVVADADLDLVIVDRANARFGSALAAATATLPLAVLAERAGAQAAAIPIRPDPADLAVLQYTSGSTQAPRGVPVTHRHLAANIDAIRVATDHDAAHPSRVLSWLPLYHDMGLVAFLALPMTCGCPLVLQSPAAFALRPASWLEAVSHYRITTTGAPNFAYRLMTELLTAGLDVDLRSVRFMFSGGEPIDAAVMTRFTSAAVRYGLDPLAIVPAYGLAESTLAVTISPPGAGMVVDVVDADALETDGRAVVAGTGDRVRRLVRLGRPVPGTRLRIVDPRSGATTGARQVGRIEITGSSVVGHHYPSPPRPAGSWFSTGDLGYLAEGDLVVCGREKEVLFSAGRNVYPQDIEAVAAQVAGVRSGGVAAFGIPSEHGDRLVVAVESRSTDPPSLRRAVAAAVAVETGMSPADIVTVSPGRLPKTTSGKLRRAEARSQYLSGLLGAIGGRSPR